jgi:hypothetical protein
MFKIAPALSEWRVVLVAGKSLKKCKYPFDFSATFRPDKFLMISLFEEGFRCYE